MPLSASLCVIYFIPFNKKEFKVIPPFDMEL